MDSCQACCKRTTTAMRHGHVAPTTGWQSSQRQHSPQQFSSHATPCSNKLVRPHHCIGVLPPTNIHSYTKVVSFTHAIPNSATASAHVEGIHTSLSTDSMQSTSAAAASALDPNAVHFCSCAAAASALDPNWRQAAQAEDGQAHGHLHRLRNLLPPLQHSMYTAPTIQAMHAHRSLNEARQAAHGLPGLPHERPQFIPTRVQMQGSIIHLVHQRCAPLPVGAASTTPRRWDKAL